MDSTGAAQAVNTFGAAGLLSRRAGPASTFYAFDAQGNVAERLDSTGSVISSDMYDGFGARTSTASTMADPFGYGGQEGYYTDKETNLLDLTHRYYDPGKGRFLTRDPLGYLGGIDLYAYTANDPTNASDPLGLAPPFVRDPTQGDPEYNNLPNDGADDILSEKGTSSASTMSEHPGMYAGTCRSKMANDMLNHEVTTLKELPLGMVMPEEEFLAGSAAEGETVLKEGLADACNLCFTPDTPVLMADGTTKPIQQVRPGDQVISRNEQTGKDVVGTVSGTRMRIADALVTIHLAGADGQTWTVTATPEHPFMVAGKGWVEAGSLGVGTSIVTRAGPLMAVQSVSWQRQTGAEKASGVGGYAVYNFTVEGTHTYFVGSDNHAVLVHNSCSSNARILRSNLEAEGRDAAPGDAAHHIVASGDARAADSRQILANEGIGTNDAINGVFLPKNGEITQVGMQVHASVHTNVYYQSVEQALRNAQPGTIPTVLSDIGSQLQRGSFPH